MLYDLEPFGRVSATRRHAIDIAVLPVHQTSVGTAEANSALEQAFQNRLQVEGRAANDLEHVGGGGLLLKRIREFLPARLELFFQTGGRIATVSRVPL